MSLILLVAAAGAGACSDVFSSGEQPPRLSVAEVFDLPPLVFADAGAPPPPVPAPVERPMVVLISIDGLRPDALFLARTPHLMGLANRGAYTWQAQTILPSYTLPSHASMLSGMPAEQHGIFHNDGGPGFITVPTVLGVAKAAGKKVVVVVGKDKLGQLTPPGCCDVFRLAATSDDAVVAAAVAEVAAGFDLMFVHLPDVDYAGHAWGWMTRLYLSKVLAADNAIGRLLAALPPQATVIATADHGGEWYTHGSSLPEHRTIPWIIAGPGIAPGRRLAAPIATIDTAATVASVLGLQLGSDVPAVPVLEAWMPAPP
ncbi:MAG TPA: alkaline phosphatase family protein [Polyangia bacterium]